MKIHHVGYLVKDLREAINNFEFLGYHVLRPTCNDSLRGVDICFLENGSTCLEVVSPHKGNNNFNSLQKKVGNGPYHICYVADDFQNDINILKNQGGWLMIKEPLEAPAIDNRKVVFFYNSDIGIVEILENK